MQRLDTLDLLALLAYDQIQYQIKVQRIAKATGKTVDNVLDEINHIYDLMNVAKVEKDC